MILKKRSLFSLLLVVLLSLTACSTPTVSDDDMGELVPAIVILSSLPEANAVNYEMAEEIAQELRALGIDATAQPTDFAVLLDIIYGADMDYDAYTIGWSGRVERLDPDMFIYSINHSSQAVAGGNNTDRYRNPAFDAVADAQRQEMDITERQRLVYEAQRILAEDVPRITLYSRANIQTYNKDLFTNVINIPGEGLFNEWTPFEVTPTGDQTVLRVASNVNIDDINPLSALSVYAWRNLRLIYDKLVRLSPSIEPVPWAAVGWDVVDTTTIDVELRQGMKFHDGVDVTVEDVKFSYDFFVEQEVGYFASFLVPI